MDALLSLATAAEKVEEPKEETDAAAGKQYNRKTRPTHTAYQKAVMTRCEGPR